MTLSTEKKLQNHITLAARIATLELAKRRLLDLPARTFAAEVVQAATWGNYGTTTADLVQRAEQTEQAVKTLLDVAIRAVLRELQESLYSEPEVRRETEALVEANRHETEALALARDQLLDLPARITAQVVQVAMSPRYSASTRGAGAAEQAEDAVKTLLDAEIRAVLEKLLDVITPGWRGQHDPRAAQPSAGRPEPPSVP